MTVSVVAPSANDTSITLPMARSWSVGVFLADGDVAGGRRRASEPSDTSRSISEVHAAGSTTAGSISSPLAMIMPTARPADTATSGNSATRRAPARADAGAAEVVGLDDEVAAEVLVDHLVDRLP